MNSPERGHSLIQQATTKFCLGAVSVGGVLITPAATAEYSLADTFPTLACVGADKTALRTAQADLSASYLVDVYDPAIPHAATKVPASSQEKATYQEAQKWRKFDLARQHNVTVFDLGKTINHVNKSMNGGETPDVAKAYKLTKNALRPYGIKLHVPQLDDPAAMPSQSDRSGIGILLLGTLHALNDIPKELTQYAGLKHLRIEPIDNDEAGDEIAGQSLMKMGTIRLNSRAQGWTLGRVIDTFGHELGHHLYLAVCGGTRAMLHDEALQAHNPAGFRYTGQSVPAVPIPSTLSEQDGDVLAATRDLEYADALKPNVAVDIEKNLAHVAFLAPYNAKSSQEDVASIFQLLVTKQSRPLLGLLGDSPLGQKTYLMEARLRRALPGVAAFMSEYFGSVIINS